jgi:PadR family transcriptional regulator, regulatory protein PadR
MPNPPFMAGVPELLILSLLKGREEMYGYEIVAAIGEATGQVVSLKEGVVYPLLHTLEEGGLLKTQQRPANGRTRVYYALTAKGVRRLFELTDEWRRMQGAVARTLGQAG